MGASFKFKQKFNFAKLRAKSKKAFDSALEKGAIQMLDWSANGSSLVQERSPIRWGVLRASGSVFVGNKLIKTNPDKTKGDEKPTPNETYNGKKRTITIGYNTAYATKMHESKLNPGKFSAQAGSSTPGNQWLLKHLQGDGPILMKTIANFLKSEF